MLLSVALVLALPGSAGAFGPLGSFGEFGVGPGQLNEPAQVAVDAAGDLYVADSGNDRVSVFSGAGAFLRAFGAGELAEPKDVALDGSGRAFVADYGNDRVAVFSAAGAFLFEFGVGSVVKPTGISVDGSVVFVADSGSERIAVFSTSGAPLDPLPLTASPTDVIVGADRNVYVASFAASRVDVLTREGEFIGSFGEAGPGMLSGPVALAFAGGEILVADQVAERIERFDGSGGFLSGFEAEPGVAGVAVACGGNVFAVEQEALFARVQRFGEPDTPLPPCAEPPPGEPVQVSLVRVPPNKFRFAGLVKNRGNGSAVLFVRVPGPGKVILKGRGVRRLARGAPRVMRVRLPIKPKVRLRHFLKRHGKGRIRVEVTFRPVGGEPFTREKPILLKRKRR